MMEYTADSDKLINLFHKYILHCDRDCKLVLEVYTEKQESMKHCETLPVATRSKGLKKGFTSGRKYRLCFHQSSMTSKFVKYFDALKMSPKSWELHPKQGLQGG